jgi:hypothetical protein
MAQHTLYAYVEGNDLDDVVADEIVGLAGALISDTSWRFGTPWLVNQRHDDDPSLGPDDLPDWELGLNFDLPDPHKEPPGWFVDVQRIAVFCGKLHTLTGRGFVIGIADNHRGYSEDLFYIRTASPDLNKLRMIIGVGGS